VDASGNMTDLSGHVIAVVTQIGFDPRLPTFDCTDKGCEVRAEGEENKSPKQKIDCFGGRTCFLDPATNWVYGPGGDKPVAVIGPGGKMVYFGDDSEGGKKVDLERLKKMRDLLREKRASMKRGIMNKIVPDKRLLARAKDKWSKGEDGRIVSSWPVKMDRMILKDKAIPAVLQRSIDSRNVDVPVTAIVERHIYAEDGRNIIIPAGSRIIGQASGGAGTNRVAKISISWNRLVRPDGGTFHFSATSGDAQGRGGVAGYLDEQFLARYGKPILESALVSAVSYMIAVDDARTTNTDYGTVSQSDRAEAAQDARRNFIQAMQTIFEQMIEESTSIPPVVFVPSGTRLTVFANEDLWLRSEEDDVDDYEAEYGEDSKEVSRPDERFGNAALYLKEDEDDSFKNNTSTSQTQKQNQTQSQSQTSNQGQKIGGGNKTTTVEDFYAKGSASGIYEPERMSAPLPTTQQNRSGKDQSLNGFF